MAALVRSMKHSVALQQIPDRSMLNSDPLHAGFACNGKPLL